MKSFAQLYQALDGTTSTRSKTEAIVQYLAGATAADAAWAVYFLAGGKLRRLVPVRELRQTGMQQSGLPAWLFDECYQSVGDLAETIALLWPEHGHTRQAGLAQWISSDLLPMQQKRSASKDGSVSELLHQALSGWDASTRFVCLKLMTGGLRVGVSRQTVVRALAQHCGIEPSQIAQRMMGYLSGTQWPDAARYERLISTDQVRLKELEPGQPYPFFLAHPLPAQMLPLAQHLGAHTEWQFEWKWDGIRAQVIRRGSHVWIWSRGEELVSQQFPEVCAAAENIPDNTVIDGELLVWQPDAERPDGFAALQRRLGRTQVTTRLIKQFPVILVAYDLLEFDGADWRTVELRRRRAQLETIFKSLDCSGWRISPVIAAGNWEQVEKYYERAREQGVEGLMIKSLDSQYGTGRTRQAGLWYKFKSDPMTIDAVLIYAQRGHGRRAGLYTDYTFGVWDAPADCPDRSLVPVAKAYSGLSDAQIRQVDRIIKSSTQESFGPVRKVEPVLVFEIGFEAIAASSRHKSGVALRFPRMLRWRTDKPAHEADTLQALREYL